MTLLPLTDFNLRIREGPGPFFLTPGILETNQINLLLAPEMEFKM